MRRRRGRRGHREGERLADLQDDLEEADTREELEAVYLRLVQAR